MSGIDVIVLAILAGSTVLGVMRGLIKEVFSLLAWVAAFLAAKWFGPGLAPLFPGTDTAAVQYLGAMVTVFLVVLIAAGLSGGLLSGIAKWAGLGAYDRVLGAAFGFARGGVAILFLALLAGLTAIPQTQTWQSAMSSPALERAARYTLPFLPRELAGLIKYS